VADVVEQVIVGLGAGHEIDGSGRARVGRDSQPHLPGGEEFLRRVEDGTVGDAQLQMSAGRLRRHDEGIAGRGGREQRERGGLRRTGARGEENCRDDEAGERAQNCAESV
jgi:hypothetical protein